VEQEVGGSNPPNCTMHREQASAVIIVTEPATAHSPISL
jgi:hypothetical protein